MYLTMCFAKKINIYNIALIIMVVGGRNIVGVVYDQSTHCKHTLCIRIKCLTKFNVNVGAHFMFSYKI